MSEHLTTVVAGAVLPTVAAGAGRQVLGPAGGVGAGDQRGCGGLPGRATVARVAARHLPLRDSHCLLSLSSARSARAAAAAARPAPPSAGPPEPRACGR